jgi:hypothetical protein
MVTVEHALSCMFVTVTGEAVYVERNTGARSLNHCRRAEAKVIKYYEYVSVCVCMCLYVSVSVCMCLYVSVCVCMCL